MASFNLQSSNEGILNAYVDYSINGTTVNATLYVRKGTQTTTGSQGRWRFRLTISGVGYVDLTTDSSSKYVFRDWVAVASYTGSIVGTSQIYAYVTGPSGTAMANYYCEGNAWVTTISAPTIKSFSLKDKTPNSATMQFSCSKADTFYYKLSTQSIWTRGANNITSGEFTINNLAPNTSYTIQLICRNWISESQGTYQDSQTSMTIKTDAIAMLSEISNINVGESHIVEWVNTNNYETFLKLVEANEDETLIEDYHEVTGTSMEITPNPEAIYMLTSNSKVLNARYILTTIVNDVEYQDKKDFTIAIVNSEPIFTKFDYEDTNDTTYALTGDRKIFINGYSKIKGIVTNEDKAQAQNRATMVDYKFVVGNQEIRQPYSNTDTLYFELPNVIDNNVLTMYATDSRDFTTKVEYNLDDDHYKIYESLVISNASIERQDGGASSKVNLIVSGTFWNNSFGSIDNTIDRVTYAYKYTNQEEEEYSEEKIATFTINEDRFFVVMNEILGDLGADGYNIEKTFNIRITASDKLSSKTTTLTLGMGTPAIAIYDNNVAIGQKYNTSLGGKLQVNGEIYKNGKIVPSTQTEYIESDNDTYSCNYLNDKFSSEVVLYNDEAGTNGDVTLSDSSSNYEYIEIFYGRYSGSTGMAKSKNYVKVYNPSGNYVNLTMNYNTSNNTLLQLSGEQIYILGRSITRETSNIYVGINVNGTIQQSGTQNNYLIFRVVGHK